MNKQATIIPKPASFIIQIREPKMKTADADILVVPGLGHAGAGHWQHRWVEKIRTAQFVEHEDFNAPNFDAWVENLEQAIIRATRPVILVGHSLGVQNIVAVSDRLNDSKVKGAFLVSPPDVDEGYEIPEPMKAFANVSRDPLKFPSMMIASSNNPLCSPERAAEFAACWGSDFHIAGDAGQIDIASGHGPWPEGLLMFTRLMTRIS